MIRDEEVYRIGTITKSHGIKGEVNFNFDDDVFDRVDAEYLVFQLDGIMVPFFMEEYRFKSSSVALVKFEGIDTEQQARALVGTKVFFPYALKDEDDPENLTWNYFVGFSVTNNEQKIGTIRAVDNQTINTLFEVELEDGGEVLIPAQEVFIEAIDTEGRTVHMTLPDGLLDLDSLTD